MIGSASFSIGLPDWCQSFADSLPDRLTDECDRMGIAIELARNNVEAASGGPFGALVTTLDEGCIIAIGVNRVEPECCSSAHAEIVALSLAQKRIGSFNLAEFDGGPLALYSSCEPCAMCLGAIPWSGIRRLVCGATREDASETGFDEGERMADWTAMLERRGISVATGLLRAEAASVLLEYRDRGARIYNP
ncbi:MAG: nucleoside deaminase [Wenzhouxiangellaceae bacterium]